MPEKETPEIHSLDPVGSLREAWANEAQNFTPWLVEHIGMLNKALNMELKVKKREKTLQLAGRVDIYAEQVNTKEDVVIENQLGGSDDSHCLRLLGYAAELEANILVWVAKEFTPYHLSILEWLNETDTINVYAVKVQLYRVNKVLVADFQTVVEPPQSRETASRSGKKAANTLYAEFYRPLVARLRQSGIHKVGRGGWNGRWRSFQTGLDLDGVVYATRAESGKVQVFLSLGDRQERFNKLKKHQKEINSKLNKLSGTVSWTEEDNWFRVILESNDPFSLTGPEAQWKDTRQWMAENLPLLREVLQSYIEKLGEGEKAASAQE